MSTLRVTITPRERRLLARSCGRGRWAKRIPATLPANTVAAMRVFLGIIEPHLRRP